MLWSNILSDIDILSNRNRGTCCWVEIVKAVVLRIRKLQKSGLEKMLEEQMYREAEWSWEREGKTMANLRFLSLDMPFWFSHIPWDSYLSFLI